MRTHKERYYATYNDYYVAHGKAVFFNGYTKYSDIEAHFARMSPATRQAAAHEFPYMEDMRWCSQFRWAKDYYAVHGKFPTTRSTNSLERSLAQWLSKARKSENITSKQIALLNSITPDWNRTPEDTWEENLSKVKAFIQANGHFPVHSKTDVDERRLRVWVEGQKRALPKMSADKLARLDRELPKWDETEKDRWYETLKEVVAFIAAKGKAPLKNSKSKEERSLGEWLAGARWNFKHNDRLDASQIAALEAGIPGWSAGFGEQWEETLKEVVAFIAANNKWPEDSDKGTNCSLGIWMRTQRETLMNNVSPEVQGRIAALNQNIPGWDESLDQRWDRKLIALVAYVNKHDAFPSDSDKNDQAVKDLGSWYQVQKRDRKKGKLREDRKAAIDAAIPYWYDSWERKLHKAATVSNALGRIPSMKDKDEKKMSVGLWAYRQRRDKAKLKPAQIAELNRVLPLWESV